MAGEMGNGWEQWKNHVLSELKDNKGDHKCIVEKLDRVRQDIAALQVKSGVWGLVGGLIPVLIMVIFLVLKDHL